MANGDTPSQKPGETSRETDRDFDLDPGWGDAVKRPTDALARLAVANVPTRTIIRDRSEESRAEDIKEFSDYRKKQRLDEVVLEFGGLPTGDEALFSKSRLQVDLPKGTPRIFIAAHGSTWNLETTTDGPQAYRVLGKVSLGQANYYELVDSGDMVSFVNAEVLSNANFVTVTARLAQETNNHDFLEHFNDYQNLPDSMDALQASLDNLLRDQTGFFIVRRYKNLFKQMPNFLERIVAKITTVAADGKMRTKEALALAREAPDMFTHAQDVAELRHIVADVLVKGFWSGQGFVITARELKASQFSPDDNNRILSTMAFCDPIWLLEEMSEIGLTEAHVRGAKGYAIYLGYGAQLFELALQQDSPVQLSPSEWQRCMAEAVAGAPRVILDNKERLLADGVDPAVFEQARQNLALQAGLSPLKTNAMYVVEKKGENPLMDPAIGKMRAVKREWLPASLSERDAAKMAVYIGRFLYTNSREVTQENVAQAYELILHMRTQLGETPIFIGRNVVVVSNYEQWGDKTKGATGDRFGRMELIDAIRKQQETGGSLEHIEPQRGGTLEQFNTAKNEIISTLINTPPPMTFVFDGHGSPGGLYLTQGSVNADGTFTEGCHLDLADMAKICRERTEKYGKGNVQKDIMILAACFNQNFIRSLHDDVAKTNSGMPMALGGSEYNRFGYSDMANPTGSDFFSNVLKVNSPRSTIRDFWENDDALIDMNPSFFVQFEQSQLQLSENSRKDDARAAG